FLYFIFTIGFKLLLSTSSFISSITSNKSEVQNSNPKNEFGTVNIDTIPTATNSATIIVGGSVVNYGKVQFFINGEEVKETTLTTSDNFNEEIGDLKKGNNEVFVKAIMKDDSSSKQTQVYNVILKSEKPKLEIKDLQDNQKVSKPDLTISGTTDKETFIKINDMPIVVDANENFRFSLILKEGDNKIIVIAEDVAGNQEKKELTIQYQKEN
ncbi:MAG: hypothetical protein Q7R95_09050, partial [bacterium]|nr:hypothetical protein [bacterium]